MIFVFRFLLLSLLLPALSWGMTYSGGAWVDDTAFVFDGTSWVQASKWHYTGSAWQEIEAGVPPTQYTLTINPEPVNGTITGQGIDCPGDCNELFNDADFSR